ncbi:hypothetical protein RDI58_010764 [Solanum bulbocastanum]|uniref:Uncharacterized protein n=1 Tax=Solanum bulbocastanum TaxID=147425 RepID=A0AAN8YJT7_SOLBU
MSYTPTYMMNRQGSQVPLVPIPKLKSQALVLAPKSSKKVEKKKSEVKVKKVARVSFLGVLFFMLIFGGLVPLLKVRMESVLASEKAMAPHGSADKKNRELGLAVPGYLAPSIIQIHPLLYRSLVVGEWVHGSKEKENVKETMQQRYLEGVAIPISNAKDIYL